jgi:hypothetical protein
MKFGFYHKSDTFIIVIVILLSIAITAIMIGVVIPKVAPFLNKLTTNEIIAVVSVLVAMVGITVTVILYRLDMRKAKKSRLELQVETNGFLARISCSYENLGTKQIIPKNVYLFVDQGVENEGIFQFPFMLKHEPGEYDCVLSKRCKAGGLLQFPKELQTEGKFKNTYTLLISLKHLSSESILFIDPGEKFTEDTVIRLPDKGVYRASVVFTATNADCSCATRQFLIIGQP